MNITPTLEEMAAIGFTRVKTLGKDADKIIIRNRSITFVASESHGPNGEKNGNWHWAGYSGDYFVAGWRADSISEAITTLILEERHLAYHEGRKSMQSEFQDLLGLTK